MSEEKKLPDPSTLKEEILAKYPPKIARKRAKSMVINDTKLDQQIQSNVRTIPGIISERLAWGRMFVLAPASTDFAGRETLRLADLAGFPFISLDRRGPLGRLLFKHLEASDVELDTVTGARTATAYSTCSIRSPIEETPCWSSSTTQTRFGQPTTSSTSARAAASTAVASSRRASSTR